MVSIKEVKKGRIKGLFVVKMKGKKDIFTFTKKGAERVKKRIEEKDRKLKNKLG